MYNYNIDRTICSGDTLTYFGKKYFTEGTHSLINKTAYFQCDSTMKINITVNHRDTLHRYDTISSGDTLQYLSFKYTKTGNYKHSFKNNLNCDSFFYIHLAVIKRDSTFLSFQKCIGDSLKYHDSTWKKTGNYRYFLKNKKLADSIVFISLSIKNNITLSVSNSMTVSSCCTKSPTCFNQRPRMTWVIDSPRMGTVKGRRLGI